MMEREKMREILSEISKKYQVKELGEGQVVQVYQLGRRNPQYYKAMNIPLTLSGIRQDMEAVPPGYERKNKYYLGFFGGGKLIAVLDLLLGYPKENTAWIGFFMVDAQEQGKNTGSGIVGELLEFLKRLGYERVELAYVQGNEQSRRFWVKNGFEENGRRKETEEYTACVMERIL